MADHPHSSGDEAPPTRSTRGPTRMKQLLIRKNSGERTPVNVNVTTGVATGPHADDFRSYLGVVARDRISILIPSFDHVSEGDRNIIWQDILMTFDIPNVPTLRNKCLSTVAENFRNFKSKLTSRYIFGHLKHKSPCSSYKSIDEETWRLFKESRMSEEWQAIRSKAQGTSAKNKNPHLLSRGGYRKLEEKILKQKADAIPPSQSGSPPQPPSPTSRHEKWKLARMRPSGTYSSDTAREISEKIDALVEQSSQGQFTPEGRQDILAAAIGRPEHPGRVRAAGPGVGITDYFGSSSRQPSYSYNDTQRMTEEITKKVRQDLIQEIRAEVRAEFQMLYQEQFQSMRPVQSPIEEHVIPPPPTGRSGKGSCSASAIPEDDMDDGSPCLLYILEDTEMVLVARGTEFRSATVCHGMQLLEDEVKVSVDEMIMPDASVPLSTEEIFTVEQAYKSFITWPKFLVKPVSDPSTQEQQKIPLSEDDPLSSLHLLADILDDKPLEVEYDANVFGHGSEVPIYLNSQDVRELASGTQELNISIIQLWTMYMSGVTNKLGRSDDYGFIDPQSIHESNDFEHINMSLISSFRRGKKIYFLPYISGRHWQLLVMSMQDNYALWFCSLHRPPPPQLKQAIDCSIPASMMMDGRSIVKSRKIAWISLKCNRQNGSYECGYYVMYWMTHIVRSHITRSWETRFKTTTPVPEKSLLFIRNAAAKYIVRLYNSS